jgi:hypothetical protein
MILLEDSAVFSNTSCAALAAYNASIGPIPFKGGDTLLVLGTGGLYIISQYFGVPNSKNESLADLPCNSP